MALTDPSKCIPTVAIVGTINTPLQFCGQRITSWDAHVMRWKLCHFYNLLNDKFPGSGSCFTVYATERKLGKSPSP
eukprot:6278188-Pyramimonas_sp.AAC.1